MKAKLTLPGMVMINPKYPHNVAAAIRACSCFDVDNLIWTGSRVNPEQYERLPREERMKGYAHVNWIRSEKPFNLFPDDAIPVCVEVFENSQCLTLFEHPENAIYVFGPEDGSVPQVIRRHCHQFVHIPSRHCLNVSAAINVVLAHRTMTRQLNGLQPILPLAEMLREERGETAPVPCMDLVGWSGK
jgi:tRNA(Leu) C34 or U34 (ribose-2'-O)-methylase TrmL